MAGGVIPSRFEQRAEPPVEHVWAAFVESVYDGDTFTAQIDLGLDTWVRRNVRVAGINAPEMRGADSLQGERSRDYLRGRISGKWVVLRAGKSAAEKFGRVLARPFIVEGGAWVDLSAEMLERGYARPFMTDRDPTVLS